MKTVNFSPEVKEAASAIDLIVFDIDGVLIDTKTSFISSIITTARYYINEYLNIPVDLSRMTNLDALEFKEFTGFNNDWNLTKGLITYLLINEKSDRKLDKESFLREVDSYGGGLPGISIYLDKNIESELKAFINKNVDLDRVTKIFQEFYAGVDYCEKIYGFEPGHYWGKGSIENEKVLIDTDLLRSWRGKAGILTGRAEKETEIALEMIGFDGFDAGLVACSDNKLPDKPEPDKMEVIVNNAKCRNVLYIGDTIDDYLTTVNYNNLGSDTSILFGLVIDPDTTYPDASKMFSSNSVNHLLEFVINSASE